VRVSRWEAFIEKRLYDIRHRPKSSQSHLFRSFPLNQNMLRRSRRLLTGSLLRLVVVFLVLLHGVPATTASAATRRMRGGSAVSSPLASLHHRGLSLVSGRAREEETKEEASEDENKKVEAVASPDGTGGRGGATGKTLASEGASMTTAAATKAKSADKPTGSSATSAAARDTEATAGNATASSNSTHNSPSTAASSANSTQDGADAMDDASGAIDDDTEGGASPAHYSQWDVTNATDFDGMLRNQTYRGPGLLPPDDADPPPHWDVAMTALFAGLAVLLCVGTAFRRYRNQQRQRENYEPIHSITV
jgi:hypothetical protein